MIASNKKGCLGAGLREGPSLRGTWVKSGVLHRYPGEGCPRVVLVIPTECHSKPEPPPSALLSNCLVLNSSRKWGQTYLCLYMHFAKAFSTKAMAYGSCAIHLPACSVTRLLLQAPLPPPLAPGQEPPYPSVSFRIWGQLILGWLRFLPASASTLKANPAGQCLLCSQPHIVFTILSTNITPLLLLNSLQPFAVGPLWPTPWTSTFPPSALWSSVRAPPSLPLLPSPGQSAHCPTSRGPQTDQLS